VSEPATNIPQTIDFNDLEMGHTLQDTDYKEVIGQSLDNKWVAGE
jgi:hypothetical protein